MTEDREDQNTSGRPRDQRQTPSENNLNKLIEENRKLDRILEEHKKWLDSDGTDGQRAMLGEKDLSKARLYRANLSKAVLRAAYLSEAELQEADLSEAMLWKADLSGARLRGANLSGAELAGADLAEAWLQDADLSGVTGLYVQHLQGADVSNAKLPEAIAKFEELGVVKETSQSARKLFISMLVACAYSVLAVVTTDTGGTEELTLPIVNIEIGVAAFYIATSGLLTLLFWYFHLQMQRLWEELAELPAIFPNGKPLDKKIHPWLITGIVRAHVKFLKEEPSPAFFLLQRLVVVFLAWGTVPVTLGILAYMYLLHYDKWGSAALILLLTLTASWAVAFYRKAAQTLELKTHRQLQLRKPDPSEEEKVGILKSTSFRFGVVFLLLAGIVWFVRYGLL